MSKVMKLTFNGSFRVLGARETTLRCGPHKMPRLIQYTTTISSKPELLDERGFIIDWRDISSAVAHHYRFVNKFPSCEKFSSEICDIVAKLLDGRCSSIDVEVSIKGLPARMNTTYSPELMS